MASLVVTDGDDRLRRVEHWLSGPTDQVLYATVQLFNGMLSTADAAMRWELGDAGSERAGAVGVDAESGGGAAATQHLLEALKIVAGDRNKSNQIKIKFSPVTVKNFLLLRPESFKVTRGKMAWHIRVCSRGAVGERKKSHPSLVAFVATNVWH